MNRLGRNRREQYLVLAMVAIGVAVLVASLAWPHDDRDGSVELGGMELSGEERDELVRESMGVKRLSQLPARSPRKAARTLESKLRGGVREFRLEARPVRWEYREGQHVAAWGYEGQVPGPAMVVREGERVRVVVRNRLPEATTVHWHGVDVPWTQDGVPGVNQKAIAPGRSYTYEFVARPAGTRFYHTHGGSPGDEARQLDLGLAGPLIITPREPDAVDVDETIVLDEWSIGEGGLNAAMMSGAGHAAHEAGYNVFTFNGRAAPDTAPIRVGKGDRVRIRFINAGTSTTHPMHIHGHNVTVTAADGNPVPAAARALRNVITVAPGETYDVTFTAANAGVWAVHCHELHHADAGMATLLQYGGFSPVDAEAHGGAGGQSERDKGDDHADGDEGH